MLNTMHSSTFLLILSLVHLLHLAFSSGSLEVRLISSRSCFVKLCVKKPHAQPLDSCLLKSQLIQLQSQKQRIVNTPFYFPFPETFILSAEVFDTQRVALHNYTSKERFVVGSEFTPAQGSSEFLDIAFRSTCHPSYYGNGCQRYCKASVSYTCDSEGKRICREGWSSEQCDQPICQDGCQYGRCVEPGRCECDHGFFGPNCKECRRSEACRHGKCRDNQPFTCACEPGWGGIFCERDLEYCTRHDPCKNGGVCSNGGVQSDFTCRCPEGYVGTTCEIAVPSICQHHGICRNGGLCTTADTKLGRCECTEGFEGRYCEKRKAPINEACSSTSCKNGGSCLNGSNCVCPQCFSGSDCSVIDENCLWQRANTTQDFLANNHDGDKTTHITILMLLAMASILLLATCVVVFFLKYKRMRRLIKDPITQNAINEHRQIHELPKRLKDCQSPSDEAYKVFVIPSKKCKDLDDIDYEKGYISPPRGRYRTLPCIDVVAVSSVAVACTKTVTEPDHHYTEIEFRPTTVALEDKKLADNACVV
uniref:Delta-like protein n=1 Tax=Haemonchus contortus TaxID=6289 RepID=A0A7I4YUA3_HAECO